MSQSLLNSTKNKSQVQEEEDDDLVILPDVDNSELIARFKLSLVGRLFNKERRSVESLLALLPRPSIWDVEGRVRGLDLGNHRFQLDFDSEEDLQKVLSKRPCHYNKWSFALERWAPHIGDSFPNTITFWVTAMGIPTHFWLEPIFRALGKRLGQVGLVEAKTAKFQVGINADLPLKFSLRAQLPTGEIVPVSLEYVNLHRWCHSCHLISHEDETCPLLTEEQREQFRLSKEANKDQGQAYRKEVNRFGDLSKRPSSVVPKLPSYHERRSGEGTQRDNRDSVWKRIDSRYAHRDDHREITRRVPRDRDVPPTSKETYNKRRYDESFTASRHREETRKAEREHVPASQSSKGERASEDPRVLKPAQPSPSSDPPRPPLEHSLLAKQITSSPDHVRERPFRLALKQKSSGDLKLKNKVSDLGDSSESVSSAQKSLRFADDPNRSSSKTLDSLPPASSEEKKKKSWYELTMEEEAEALEKDSKKEEAPRNLEAKEKSFAVEDPNGEKILEEEDWMLDGDNFDDDDLMEDDELLYEENQKEKEIVSPGAMETTPNSREVPTDPIDNLEKETAEERQIGTGGGVTPYEPRHRREGSSSSRALQSPSLKKKGSPIPLTAGLSLKKRNFLLGRASPKLRESKVTLPPGPSPAMGNSTKMKDEGNEGVLSKTIIKAAKVESRPPKIPK
ncbi:hypothetical protein Bca52824_013494 [Brassica carinata]|uniref:DUF4283 domain-containing protein n=1 Tax=Brassica carinata TaxID=52824 RepID=A0A8X7VZ16_BRACI|nr:hypothetical protein Bca52824_013494 [Brassica carinata]